MKNYHTKSDDEINEMPAGTSGGQPLKMRRLTNASLNGEYSTEYVTEGFKDDEHRMNRVHDFDPTNSNMTREDSFREIVLEKINEPFTSALFIKLNEDGTMLGVDCVSSPENASAIVRSIAAMIGKYYKAVAYDSATGTIDCNILVENNYQLIQNLMTASTSSILMRKKLVVLKRLEDILKNGKQKNNNT